MCFSTDIVRNKYEVCGVWTMTNIHQSQYEPSKNLFHENSVLKSCLLVCDLETISKLILKIIGISFDDIFTHDLNSTLNSGNVLQCKVAQASYVKHIFVQLFCETHFVKHILWNTSKLFRETYLCLNQNCMWSIFILFCETYLCLNQNCLVTAKNILQFWQTCFAILTNMFCNLDL